MASEIRVDKINSLSGVGTVTLSPTGVDIAGITTAATLRATTGIVTTLTATTGDITTLRTPTGIATNFTADKISLPDSTNGSLNIGIGSELKLNHNGTDSFITEVGGGDLYIQGSDIILRDAGTLDKHIEMTQNGAVDIYYDNSKKFETTTAGVTVTGGLTATTGTFTGAVTLADGVANGLKIGAGEDLVLQHNGTNSFIDNNTGDLYIQTTGSGDDIVIESADDITLKVAGAATAIQATGGGSVDLYHNNTKRLETSGSGVVIPSGANNCLRVFGSNAAHATSALIIGQNNSTTSQLRAYGPDSSTNGRIEFRSSRSDATNTVNLIYDSGNLEFASGNGISFAATGDAGGMSSELLDDYEEGTFTPSFGFHLDNYNGSYSFQQGYYTKIGRMVNLSFQLVATKGTATGGTATIYNLPFTALNADGARASGSVGYFEGFTCDKPILILVEQNQTQFPLRFGGGVTNATSINQGHISSSFRIYITITYTAA